jgi:hypothetical protein
VFSCVRHKRWIGFASSSQAGAVFPPTTTSVRPMLLKGAVLLDNPVGTAREYSSNMIAADLRAARATN